MTQAKKEKSISKDEKNLAYSVEMEDSKRLLEIKNLKTYFYTEEGVVKAVDGVSFDLFKDETLGLVGETGCGKSVTALSILRLVRAPGEIVEGTIKFNGINLLELSEADMRNQRGNSITMIFQDPLNSLNPVISCGDQVSEVFLLHQEDRLKKILDEKKSEREKKIHELEEFKTELKDRATSLGKKEKIDFEKKITELKNDIKRKPTLKSVSLEESEKIIEQVGIPDARGILDRYPHELSGGMRQRVMIAMALSCKPLLLIADEPTTALDVTIQAQILELMKDLKKGFKTSILMITHDLGIIAEICDRVAVMYSGSLVEYATVSDLYKNPRHPYTKGLIGAIPRIEKKNQKLTVIRGMVPNLIYPPSGCRFHPRCDERMEICDKVKPRFLEIGDKYFIACHLFDPEYQHSPKYQRDKIEDEKSYLV